MGPRSTFNDAFFVFRLFHRTLSRRCGGFTGYTSSWKTRTEAEAERVWQEEQARLRRQAERWVPDAANASHSKRCAARRSLNPEPRLGYDTNDSLTQIIFKGQRDHM